AAAPVAAATPSAAFLRRRSPCQAYRPAVAPSTIVRTARVLGCDSGAAAATTARIPPVRGLVHSTGSATTAARLATKSGWPNAFVRLPQVMIHAVIGMRWYQTTAPSAGRRRPVARTIIQ